MKKIITVICLLVSYLSQGQFYDSTQLENINNNRLAHEGDMYLDTSRNDLRIGLSHRKLGQLTDDQKLSVDTINNVIHLEDGDSVELEKVITGPRFYVGKFQITATGNDTIRGIPFQPTSVVFEGYANIESYNLNTDNGVGNNNTGIANSYGYMRGYARDDGGPIDEQVICSGGSGNSINDISRYSSDSHSIGIRYGNQNGDNLGVTSATLTSFRSDGFVINVDNYADGLVIIFEAHR